MSQFGVLFYWGWGGAQFSLYFLPWFTFIVNCHRWFLLSFCGSFYWGFCHGSLFLSFGQFGTSVPSSLCVVKLYEWQYLLHNLLLSVLMVLYLSTHMVLQKLYIMLMWHNCFFIRVIGLTLLFNLLLCKMYVDSRHSCWITPSDIPVYNIMETYACGYMKRYVSL